MGQPYVGEIRLFAGNFNPSGWMFCEGQSLPINENEILFQLIGTTYGGDGQETFNLPNLASRVPIHMGTASAITYQLAEMAGTEQETLSVQQLPAHSHPVLAAAGNQVLIPSDTASLAAGTGGPQGLELYVPAADLVGLNPAAVGVAGGSQPHENTQPFLCINFIISLFGIFPSQT